MEDEGKFEPGMLGESKSQLVDSRCNAYRKRSLHI